MEDKEKKIFEELSKEEKESLFKDALDSIKEIRNVVINGMASLVKEFKKQLEPHFSELLLPLIETIDEFRRKISYVFKFEEIIINNIDELYELEKKANCYFRGIGNSEWDLLPSILVNYKGVPKENEIIAELGLEQMLATNTDELCEELKDKSLYDYFARVQHYFTKTMLIDFSKDFWIAMWFALELHYETPMNPNKNKAIFVLEPLNDEAIISDHIEADIYLSKVLYKVFNSNSKELNEMSAESVLSTEGMHPSAKLIVADCNNNLRIKRQKGVFFSFVNCCIGMFENESRTYFKDQIKKDFIIKKYIIPNEMVDGLASKLKELHPEYTIPFLLEK